MGNKLFSCVVRTSKFEIFCDFESKSEANLNLTYFDIPKRSFEKKKVFHLVVTIFLNFKRIFSNQSYFSSNFFPVKANKQCRNSLL